jgi:hypothetical protein
LGKALTFILAVETSTISKVAREVKLMLTHFSVGFTLIFVPQVVEDLNSK